MEEILLCTPNSVICMIFLFSHLIAALGPLDAPGFAVTALIPGVVSKRNPYNYYYSHVLFIQVVMLVVSRADQTRIPTCLKEEEEYP